ncbi:MAG: hypothetical protein H0W04_00575 [Chthoniobacterales bacterium]|nr:hypothetical protein [Chthoniobacterales bacterium]
MLRPFVTGSQGAAPRDLGVLGLALDVNNRGQTVGFTLEDISRPFLVDKSGQFHFLGALPGGLSAGASAINDFGQVAGSSLVGGVIGEHAFLSAPNGGALRDLGTLGGIYSHATDVNNLGQVVGFSSFEGSFRNHAFVSAPDGGALTDLGVLSPATMSYAYVINDAGVILARVRRTAGTRHSSTPQRKACRLLTASSIPPWASTSTPR